MISDGGTLIPISDEQAKLGQEIAKVVQESICALSGVASFIKESLGSVPQDLIGYLGGDWLRVRRAENIAIMMDKARMRLESLGVKDQKPASLSVALPILRGAADESRETLQDLWARLLAAALDPSRSECVRHGFADAISRMDPPDAVLLTYFNGLKTSHGIRRGDDLTNASCELGISFDEFMVSMDNLISLGLLQAPNHLHILISPFGREFLRVVIE